jgi:hypothetical protein
MAEFKKYHSKGYWSNYIDAIIESIKEDKDTIIDMLIYGDLEKAEIVMLLSDNSYPSYRINIAKRADKSPFGEEDNE